jgi:hypothetical protein
MLNDDFVTNQKQFANEGNSHPKVNVINLETFQKLINVTSLPS